MKVLTKINLFEDDISKPIKHSNPDMTKPLPFRNPKNGVRYKCHVIFEADEIFGSDKLIYDYIPNETQIKNSFGFEIECKKCGFIWLTNTLLLLSNKIGCSWCKNECKDIKKLTFRMLFFVFKKKLDDKYVFYIDPNKIYKTQDDILLQCQNKEHPIFKENINRLISSSKRTCDKSKGCLKCRELKPTEEKIIWHHNYEALEKIGNEKHGNGRYLYHLNKPKDLINIASKIKLICANCEHQFSTNIRSHIHLMTGCPKCGGNENYTLDKLVSKLSEKYSNGEFLFHRIKEEDIKNNKSKVTIECGKCAFNFDALITHLVKGNRKCDRCINKEEWTSEKLRMKCREKTLEGEYCYNEIDYNLKYNKRTKIPIVCLKCKDNGFKCLFYQTLDDHFNGKHGCVYCAQNYPWKYRIKEACEEKAEEGQYSYDLINFDNIDNQSTEIPIICLKCKKDNFKKYTFDQKIVIHFTLKCGCPRCGKSIPWDYDRFFEFLDRLPKSFTDNYDYSQVKEVTSGGVKVPIKCKTCQRTFHKSPSYHISLMRGCGYCAKSEGSKIIQMYLENHNIPFEDEVRCPGLDGKDYRYDYQIEYKGGIVIIEFDGEMHFKYVEHLQKSVENFEAACKRDVYKHSLALKNGYRIIRIDDFISKKKIEKYLIEGLECKEREYFATPKLYEKLIENVKNYVHS